MSAAAEKFIGELAAWPQLLPRLTRMFDVLERMAARDAEVALVRDAVHTICNSPAPIGERCSELRELFERACERAALDSARTLQ